MPITATEGPPARPDPVPQLLEQLLEHVRCDVCTDAVSPFEMFVCWPLAGVTAHLACYVRGQSIATIEASS